MRTIHELERLQNLIFFEIFYHWWQLEGLKDVLLFTQRKYLACVFYCKLSFIFQKIMKHFFAITLLALPMFLSSQGVLVGTSGQSPDPSATFEVRSSQGGFLLPRMTTTQRNAIPTPAQGLQIFNTTTGCVDLYFSTGWRAVSCACANTPNPAFSISPSVPTAGSTAQLLSSQPGSANFQWTIQGATPSTASGANPNVQWATPGTYAVKLVVTDSAGCSDSLTQQITVSSCSSGSTTFAYTGSVTSWTVPAGACTLTILCEGAQGGNGQNAGTGGLGASMQGTFTGIAPGSVLQVVVGGRGNSGASGNSSRGGGGGGGSFVYTSNNNLLVAAGGGGGGGFINGGGGPGLTTTSGGASNFGNPGGTNGSGGTVTTSNGYDGGGGAGWLSDGASNTQATGGKTRTNNWTGGSANAYSPTGVNGGFGGGGGAEHGAGGGGGYSGGGGGRNGDPYGAGGGGSFNGGSNQVNQQGVRSGHGRVVITWN